MKKRLLFAFGCSLVPVAVWAVYAPIPEQDQGKAVSVRLGSSVYHDSNIFGSATGAVSSMVYNVSPTINYNGSLTDQTFASLGYQLSYDHIVDRPGKQNLSSHTFTGRLAHAFNSTTSIDFNELYQISKNPQSLLAGIPLNTNQSLKLNQFDMRFNTSLGAKTGVVFKYRHMVYSFDAASLALLLDRREQLGGLEVDFALLPATKLVGEYRYQDISYDNSGTLKNKRSHFLLAGFNHNPGQQVLLSARVGMEDRSREGATDATVPYAELSARYTYSEGSFFSGGYIYTLEEASDVIRYTDSRLHRVFANVQHRLSGPFTVSASLSYESAELQGRGVTVDLAERTTRLGLALSWQPVRQWTFTATYDLDRIASADANRDQKRNRVGVAARLSL
ncbi:MAG: hypothetical protein Q8M02_10385 [Candidatus Didemnitutus sp.]|nr:hypothetical protein [Candidatus Didemnitutus sp.]